MTKIIEIIVLPTGQSRLETKGFQGASCQQASQFLETALGARQSEQLTADCFATEVSHNRLREGQS
jgi:hypothetical protein